VVTWGRPDLDGFELGALYEHRGSGEILEFLGVAFMLPELNGEDVGIFRHVGPEHQGTCVVATRASYANGETFESVQTAFDRRDGLTDEA
jgi:hypothetical protein